MKRHPISDHEKDRAALVEVAEIVTAALIVVGGVLFVRWWVWLR